MLEIMRSDCVAEVHYTLTIDDCIAANTAMRGSEHRERLAHWRIAMFCACLGTAFATLFIADAMSPRAFWSACAGAAPRFVGANLVFALFRRANTRFAP